MNVIPLTDPFFSWFAILVMVFLVGAFACAIDRYEEDRQRREQEQYEDAMKAAQVDFRARLRAVR